MLLHTMGNEALDVIGEVFKLHSAKPLIMIEINGHIFVAERRIWIRSLWYRRVLGVLAKPFDLTKAEMENRTQNKGGGYGKLGNSMGTTNVDGRYIVSPSFSSTLERSSVYPMLDYLKRWRNGVDNHD